MINMYVTFYLQLISTAIIDTQQSALLLILGATTHQLTNERIIAVRNAQSSSFSLLILLLLVGRYFAYVTTNSVSELLLRGHESRGLLVKSLEFIIKLACDLSSHSRQFVQLGALCLHLLEFFLGCDGLSNFSSEQLAPITLFPEAVVDILTVHANPVAYSLRRLFFLFCLGGLGLVVSGKFVYISLNRKVFDLLTNISLFGISILLVRFCA